MAKDPMEVIREAGAAARAGMGLEDNEEQDETTITDQHTSLDEEEASEEVAPEESEEVSEEAETEESEEEESGEQEPQPRDRSVFRQLNEIRSQKRAEEADKKRLLDLIGAQNVEDAAAILAKLQESAPLSEEFLVAAAEMGVEDPQNLKKLADLVAGQVRSNIASEITPMREQLSKLEETTEGTLAQQEFDESVAHMDEEWNEVLPLIESEYAPTPTQAKAARDLMVEFSHDEKYFDKELDYILYREQEKFEEVLGSRKRKGMLRSQGQPRDIVQENGRFVKTDGSHESIMKAAKNLKAIANSHNFDTSDSI